VGNPRDLSRTILTLLFLGGISLAASAQTKVGDTKDACDRSDVVTFRAKGGEKVKVKAPGDETRDLSAPTREIEWFCGDSQEFSSNDEPYDRVKLKRVDNGAMTWTFFRLPPEPESGKPGVSSKTGDTQDGCDKGNLVTFDGLHGKVTVKASQALTADLPKATTEIQFKCGNTPERAANDVPFDQVRVARSMSGAISWTFFLKTAAPDPASVCNKVHAVGRLVFKDENGNTNPLARVRVKLMNEDFGPTDQEMARGFTDSQGHFDLTGTGSDSNCSGAGCKRPDPYVEFVLREPHRVEVKDPLENTARQKTDVKVNTCGDVDFGRQEWSEAELDAILYFRAQRAYQNFVNLTNDSRVPGHEGLVGVEYPTVFIGETPYTTWDTIHWPWHGPKTSSFESLDHEFGHRLRHAADGGRDHFNFDATRFVYARSHTATDVTNEGFAFNEGWAFYHKTLLNAGLPVPNGTWGGPDGDNVEGDVANQIFNLSQKCGGFPRLWKTMKEAGPNSFHSIDEYRAEFMKRNPTCGMTIKRPPRAPLVGTPVAPTATPEIKKPFPGGPHFSKPPSPMADSKKEALRLRIPKDLPATTHSSIERLSSRRVTLAQALHSDVAEAYRKALESFSSLTRESLTDGSYDKARRAAQGSFAAAVIEARLRHLREARRDLADERKSADPRLAAYLAGLDVKYARAERDLKGELASRTPGSSLRADLLPNSLLTTTVSRGK
jgi:hypothetical protein